MSVKKQISTTFLTRILSIVLSVGTSIFTARLLGVEGKGEYSIFLATLHLFVLILGFGIQPAITFHCAKKDLQPSKVYFSLFLYSGVVSLLFFGVMHLTHQFSDSSIFLHKNRNSIGYEIILAASLFMVLIMNNLKAMFSAEKMFGVLNRFQTLSVATGLVAYGIMFFGNGRWWQIPAWAIFLTHGCILLFNFLNNNWTFIRRFAVSKKVEIMNAAEVKMLGAFAKVAYFSNIAQFLNYRIDFWFVDFFHTTRELGLYSLASNLVQMIWILPQSIAQVFMPHVASSTSDIVPKIRSTARISVFVCLCFAVFAYFFIEFIIVKMYGEQFRGSAPVVHLLLLGIVPFSLTIIYASYFTGIKRNDVNFRTSVIGLAATILFDFLLIPKHGKMGAAAASGLSYCISTAYILYMFGKMTDSSLADMIFVNSSDFSKIKNQAASLRRRLPF